MNKENILYSISAITIALLAIIITYGEYQKFLPENGGFLSSIKIVIESGGIPAIVVVIGLAAQSIATVVLLYGLYVMTKEMFVSNKVRRGQ